MADEDAFLRAIIEEPDDDAHRLVYADWLEERGDVRAEFIRLQYELERLDADDPHRRSLEMREEELRLTHEAEWAKGVSGLARQWGFRRGFVERVALSYPDFLARSDELFRAAPIREIVFPDFSRSDEDWGAVAASPHLRRLTALEGPNGLTWNGLEALASSPHLSGLRSLALHSWWELATSDVGRLSELPLLAGLTSFEITGVYGTQVDLSALVGSSLLTNLVRLSLRSCHSSQYVLALARSPYLGRLSSLSLAGTALDGTTIAQLTQSARLPALVTLDLSNCVLETSAARALASSALLGQIRRLNLSVNRLAGDAVRSLAASTQLKQLRVLDLGHNPFQPSHLRSLAESDNLAGLIALHLRGNQFGKRGALEMGFLDQFPCLTTLALAYNAVGPEAAATLAATLPPGLHSLDLSWNPLGDDGVRALASSPALASLTYLDLGYTGCGDAGLEALASSPHLANLTALNLRSNRITDAGLRALARSPLLERPLALDLRSNFIGEVGARALASSPHCCRLTALILSDNPVRPELVHELREGMR